jgi:hypothetical protein
MVFGRFLLYNGAMMKTEHTPEQLAEFYEFCLRHQIVFAIIAEFNGAIAQYFSGE